jgi:hypothetical protein
MNRKEKINLIKQIQAGDMSFLEALKKERERERNWQRNFFLCFRYLAANGRISSKHNSPNNPPIAIGDLEPFVREVQDMKKLSEDFDYGKLSDRVLHIIVEVFDSLKILEENNETHLLEKY